MSNAYTVFFNGVFHSRHTAKGTALDAAYQHVTMAWQVNARHAHLSGHCAATADELSRLMGVLASTIPDARRARCAGRVVINVVVAGQSITVRRDAY